MAASEGVVESSRSVGRPRAAQTNAVLANAGAPEPTTNPIYVARLAVALLRLPEDTEPLFTVPEARAMADEIAAKFRAALDSDYRVSQVLDQHESDDIDNARTEGFLELNSDEPDLTDALVPFQVLRLNSMIQFRIRIPAKNQPRYRSMDDVPTDDYLVFWDGITLAIQWEQDVPRATGSGGHVVFDVLQDAAIVAGFKVEIRACSIGCHHKFVHGDFVTFARGDVPDRFRLSGQTPVGSTVVAPFLKEPSDLKNLWRLYSHIQAVLETFAGTKDLADAIYFLEWRARTDSAEMLGLAYERSSRRRPPNLVGWLADSWALRRSRQTTDRLLAGLWLGLVSLDAHRVNWRIGDDRFARLIEERNLGELESLFDTGRENVNAQDLSMLRTSLQEVASRTDGRMLAIATLGGAGAALAGAGITALVSALIAQR